MKIAFGICALGIGHVTRSLPIITGLLKEGHEIVVISHGRALSVIKKKFPTLKFYDINDYPVIYTEKAFQFIPYFLANSHKIIHSMLETHRLFLDIDARENFDLIISDSRYDVFNRLKPSFIILHQLRIMLKLALLRGGTMFYNHYMTKFFKKIIVPDFPTDGLSGALSHNLRFIAPERIEYVGPLSSFRHKGSKRDIDLLVSISGPEPQRSIFENKIMNEISDIKGNIVITLGRPEKDIHTIGNTKIYSYLDFKEREDIMNRSKLVISRSGYSTIMDLYTIGGKAMFIPTPGQPEQLYLAKYLHSRGIAGYAMQEDLNLLGLMKRVKDYRGFQGGYDINKSIERVWEVIL